MLRALAAASVIAAGCVAPGRELERVAKDWCLTIRASQVLPVYPLSEDLEPGDVFLVETPIADQARIYEERGFLPLDQLVTRLRGLPYSEFYRDGYFKGAYGGAPHDRPSAGTSPFPAPRAAFPSYAFEVERSAGLKLALPLSGVPAALGLLGATRARGSVTIRDAFTYAIDGESLAQRLYDWWDGDERHRAAFAAIARDTGRPVYLRAVTRVFLARGVAVSLVSLDARSAGAEAGTAPHLDLLALAAKDPERVQAAADAYREALGALGGPPGGAFEVVQASARAVSLEEDFDRPLVIGYLGFDVRVFPDGSLSAPVPSYATLAEGSSSIDEAKPLAFAEDDATRLLARFAEGPGNPERIAAWLRGRGLDIAISDLVYGAAYAREREEAVREFQLR